MTRCRTTRALTTTRRERSVRREAERLAARPRPNLPARALREGCAKPPAFSAAARARAMNGRDRLPRERMRPSRMCRSSSCVITFRARGALLPVFAMTCANLQAFVRQRTLCQVFDHCPVSGRPTAARLAAFILPSLGRSVGLPHPASWPLPRCFANLCDIRACQSLPLPIGRSRHKQAFDW